MSTTKSLERAAALAEDGKLADALAPLVDAWAQSPSEALREVVLAMDGALGAAPFEGDTGDWVDAAKKAKPGARGPLLSSLKGPKLADSVKRLEAAKAWAKDPRTSRAVEALLAEVPWSSDSSKPAWTAAFAVVAASGDPRFVELAATLPGTWKVREGIKGWLERAFAKAIAKLPGEAPALSAADAKHLDAVRAALAKAPKPKKATAGGRDEAALLAAVYANPTDDGPRLVYADVLQEKGDPRGEFVALQCAGADAKKAKALVKQHGKQWLGALAPVLGASFEFRRGFPAVAMVKFRHQADAEKYGQLPEWATLEELTWSYPNPPPREQAPYCRYAGPSMRWLKKAVGAYVPHLLASEGWPNLEVLQTSFDAPENLEAFLAAQPTKFPKLHTLRITDWPKPDWFTNVSSLGTIRHVAVAAREASDFALLFSRLGVETLEVGSWTFRRGEDGHLSRATFRVPEGVTAQNLEWRLNQLSAGLVESLDLDVPEGTALPYEALQLTKAKLRGPGMPDLFAAGAKAASGPRALDGFEDLRALHVLPDGTLLVVERARLRFVDLKTREVTQVVPLRPEVQEAAVLPRSQQLVLRSYLRLAVRDLDRGAAEVLAVPVKESSSPLQVSADERRVSYSPSGVFDLEARAELPVPRGAAKASVMSPDQAFWVRWKAPRQPYEVFRPGDTKGTPLEEGESFTCPLVHRGFLYGWLPQALVKWTPATGRIVARLALPRGHGLWLSPDGERLVAGTKDELVVLKADTLEPTQTLPGKGKVGVVGFAPDGRLLLGGQTLEVV